MSIEPEFMELTRNLDLRAFWEENQACKAFTSHKPRCAVSFSPDDHWLFVFVEIPSTLRYYQDKAYRDDLHKKVKSITAEHVGQTFFDEDTWEYSPKRIENLFGCEFEYHVGMGELLQRYREEYDDPVIYITENGCDDFDAVVEPDSVHDEHRIQYIKHYLIEIEKAIDAGSDVRGYFMWTTIDNFEWSQGRAHRMGFFRVDHDTQKRTVKNSGYWYRDLIRSQKEK